MGQILSILSKELGKMGISVYEFSRQTGLPKGRIYKWMDGKVNPKTDDSSIIKKWLGSDLMEKVPRGTDGLHIAKAFYTIQEASIEPRLPRRSSARKPIY